MSRRSPQLELENRAIDAHGSAARKALAIAPTASLPRTEMGEKLAGVAGKARYNASGSRRRRTARSDSDETAQVPGVWRRSARRAGLVCLALNLADGDAATCEAGGSEASERNAVAPARSVPIDRVSKRALPFRPSGRGISMTRAPMSTLGPNRGISGEPRAIAQHRSAHAPRRRRVSFVRITGPVPARLRSAAPVPPPAPAAHPWLSTRRRAGFARPGRARSLLLARVRVEILLQLRQQEECLFHRICYQQDVGHIELG